MTSYKDSGVDVKKGAEAVNRIKKHVESTFSSAVLRGVGSFGGAISLQGFKDMKDPVLVSSIDGVGTKTVIAENTNRWENIGADIVNHSANDVVCQGARPLFFLDYAASASLNPDVLETIVESMSKSCIDIDCALIGGETAEMPQVYKEGAHDIAGTMVGIVEREKMITGENIGKNDVLIALPSNGLHTNGYSLARKVLPDFDEEVTELGCTVGEALLKPHTCYSNTVLKIHEEIGLKGVAHITGGGIYGNLSRIIPEGLSFDIDKSKIQNLPIFELIQSRGDVNEESMFEAFNMGVGMILVVEPGKEGAVLAGVAGSYAIGKVV
ncbi:phosphoribosylformylglycinamidine cyclo-ligase [Candidatus Peribacteria bacterium]|jgi:phosphoribosylformylglycinamidine cyclo-ligase|nr:phosphoribosylformylglycinamidine cyclo-ligase [Candidatus Peribacteria bacterium]MBT4021142.1 phosphoribosylformylglycinamidine cyclo-ligase [Candidatus Peribacteria bacterium]MBT4240361.1 phosphoribosylformylglycinamidine cyclo-ligase [Candidatus Peribacteria bacterium]MBT4473743.1 phosphoribosylformylglycinamidine cyclo-ligase [Candidatus Peribacteria bacterium]